MPTKIIAIVLSVLILMSCTTYTPSTPANLCTIFDEKSSWYRAAKKAADKWQGNISVPMAIMYQESAFKSRAKPPMHYFLGVIPLGRTSNAFGYPQALDSTWDGYKQETGSMLARRSNFADAIDFIQWYMHKTLLTNGVAKTDAYRQYLNYHEGQGGYANGTYRNKSWLLKTAKAVERRAEQYSAQLTQCSKALERKRRWLF